MAKQVVSSRYNLAVTLSQHSFHKMVIEQDLEGNAEANPQMLLCPMAGPLSPAQDYQTNGQQLVA